MRRVFETTTILLAGFLISLFSVVGCAGSDPESVSPWSRSSTVGESNYLFQKEETNRELKERGTERRADQEEEIEESDDPDAARKKLRGSPK